MNVRLLSRLMGLVTVQTLITTLLATSAYAATICNGVVKVSNDFYLASQSGAVIHRFTMDAQPKSGAVVSPDGMRIAYVLDSSQQLIAVANSQGTIAKFKLQAPPADFSGKGLILALRWASNSWLQVQRHASPTASRFDHYIIPTTLVAGPTDLQPARAAIPASYCSIARITNYSACVHGSTVSVVDDVVYSRPPYVGVAPIQSVVIPVGSTATVTIDDDLKLSIKPTSLIGGFTLVATYGDAETTSRVPIGGALPIQWDSQVYALSPKLASGGVRVDILKSPLGGGQSGLEPVIAWKGADVQIVVVERTLAGKRLSVLESTSLSPPTWLSVASASLPLDEDLVEMRFITPTMALIRTENENLLLPVTVAKTGGNTMVSVGQPSVLPEAVGVVLSPGGEPINADFIDWSCVVNG